MIVTIEDTFQLELFEEVWSAEVPTLPKVVQKYFEDNWHSIGYMWANFGRRFSHGGAETNNKIEQ